VAQADGRRASTSLVHRDAWHVHRRIVRREVIGRAAAGDEREQVWQRWRELDKNLDGYAARRPDQTAVVVLEARATPS